MHIFNILFLTIISITIYLITFGSVRSNEIATITIEPTPYTSIAMLTTYEEEREKLRYWYSQVYYGLDGGGSKVPDVRRILQKQYESKVQRLRNSYSY